MALRSTWATALLYACARERGVPLLPKGGDFPQTDIVLA
jgi:uncharacterized protein with PIN domain